MTYVRPPPRTRADFPTFFTDPPVGFVVASSRRNELPALLPDAGAVVILTPLSEATRGLIGAAELAALRDGALLVNAGRGPVIDTDALLAEVGTGRLRAVLDVTDPEPPPDGPPALDRPRRPLDHPHIAGDSALGHRRAVDLAARRLGRWAAGDELENVVLGSSDGKHWRRLATASGQATGTNDTLRIPPTKVTYLRLKITAATKGLEGEEEPPLLEELRALGDGPSSSAGR